MRKRLLLLCSLLTSAVLFADEFEKNYGNGVIHIQPDSFTTVDFYAGPDSAFTYRLHMQSGSWSFSPIVNGAMMVGTTIPQWFSTLYFIPYGEYARVDIIAIDSGKGYYRTILKDDNGREVWIKKTEEVSYLSWFGFYQSVASVEFISGEVIFYERPDPKSLQRKYTQMYPDQEKTTMRPLEVKGMWMKVETRFPDPDPQKPWHVYTGWIKWRDDKQPLIKYNLMGC